MTDTVAIQSDRLSAAINLAGAELWTLRDEAGRDLLWDGDPTFWASRAPILFPIVGEARDGTLRVEGKSYAMERHGFARRQPFAVVEQTPSSVRLRLEATEATRVHWPFTFRLDMTFAIVGSRLDMAAEVTNLDDRTMPASFGWHPALRWPLPYGAPRADHRMRFEKLEPAELRRLNGVGLIRHEKKPTPLVNGRDLPLADDLFTVDALIWDNLTSRRLTYGAPGARGLDITFPDMPMLGIWTKVGSGYICVEPWATHADIEDFAGEAKDKVGMHPFAPGETRSYHMSIALTDGPADV